MRCREEKKAQGIYKVVCEGATDLYNEIVTLTYDVLKWSGLYINE